MCKVIVTISVILLCGTIRGQEVIKFEFDTLQYDTLNVGLNYFEFEGYPPNSIEDNCYLQIEGNTKHVFNIRNNTLNGNYWRLDENDNVLEVGFYLRGFKSGKWYGYFENSTTMSYCFYWEGGSQIEWNSYYRNGNLKKRFVNLSLPDNIKGSHHSTYFENGMIDSIGVNIHSSISNYGFTPSMHHGVWKKYFNSGSVKKISKYHMGEQLSEDLFDEEGNHIKIVSYEDGIKLETHEFKYIKTEDGWVQVPINN